MDTTMATTPKNTTGHREVMIPADLWKQINELEDIVSLSQNEVNPWAARAWDIIDHLQQLPTSPNSALVAQFAEQKEEAERIHGNLIMQYQELEEEYKELQALKTQEAESKQQQIDTLQHAITLIQPSNPSSVTSTTKAAKMPDPEKFDGNTDKYEGWRSKVQLKLQEPGSFPDEQAKCRYVIGLLQDKAYHQVGHLIMGDRVNTDTAAELINILNQSFGDPDPRATAERALQKCFQGARRFADYHAEMNRYLNKTLLGDESRKIFVYKGLSRELKDAIANADTVPEDYTEWITWLSKKDLRLAARRSELGEQRFRQPFAPRQPPTTPQQTQNPQTRTPSVTPGPKPTTPHPTQSNSGYYGPAPMDISSGRRTLTSEERSRRMTEGLCMYCGEPGHLARSCPAMARRNLRLNATNPGWPKPQEEQGQGRIQEVEDSEQPKN